MNVKVNTTHCQNTGNVLPRDSLHSHYRYVFFKSSLNSNSDHFFTRASISSKVLTIDISLSSLYFPFFGYLHQAISLQYLKLDIGLNFPTEEPDELGNDQAALPVPETYCTTIKNGALVTETVILD